MIVEDNDTIEMQFLLLAAELLSRYGATVFETEDALRALCDKLESRGQFVVFNNMLFTAFGKQLEQRVNLTRLAASAIDVDKLEQTQKIVSNVLLDKENVGRSLYELRQISRRRKLYSSRWELLSWPLIAGPFAIIFLGNWREAVAAGIIALVLAFVHLKFEERINYRGSVGAFEPLAAVLASFMAVFLAMVLQPLSVTLTIICGLMPLMPGYTTTRALNEIAARHVITGWSHLLNAATTFLMLAAGVVFGSFLVQAFHIVQPDYPPIPPDYLQLTIAAVLAAVAFVFYYQINTRHVVALVLSSVATTLIVIQFGADYGAIQGTALAAVFAAFVGNIYARACRCSDLIIKVPCAIILVPGGTGFRAALDFMNNRPEHGMSGALMTFGVAMAIITGYLVVDMLMPQTKN